MQFRTSSHTFEQRTKLALKPNVSFTSSRAPSGPYFKNRGLGTLRESRSLFQKSRQSSAALHAKDDVLVLKLANLDSPLLRERNPEVRISSSRIKGLEFKAS